MRMKMTGMAGVPCVQGLARHHSPQPFKKRWWWPAAREQRA
jgi:hypothetical protein